MDQQVKIDKKTPVAKAPILDREFQKFLVKQGYKIVVMFALLTVLALTLNDLILHKSSRVVEEMPEKVDDELGFLISDIMREVESGAVNYASFTPHTSVGQNSYGAEEVPSVYKPSFEPSIYESLVYPINEVTPYYYIKDGNLWSLTLSDKTVSRQLVFDAKDSIVSHDVSPDGKLIAYTVWTRVDYEEEEIESVKELNLRDFEYLGSEVHLFNTETNEDLIIYSRDVTKNLRVFDISFTRDGKKLLFSNNSLWVTDVYAYTLEEFVPLEYAEKCNKYEIVDFSPSNSFVLLTQHCQEGFLQHVVNVETGELLRSHSSFTWNDDRWLGFLDERHVLGYANEGQGLESSATDLVSYSLVGEEDLPLEPLQEKYSRLDFVFFDSQGNKIIAFGNSSDEHAFYVYNVSTKQLSIAGKEQYLIYEDISGDALNWWLTDATFADGALLSLFDEDPKVTF